MKTGEAIVRASEWLRMRCDEALRRECRPENKDRGLPASLYALFIFAALLISFFGALLNDIPSRDVALRYAPMADAFASGNFAYAFHPRIPMLHPVLAGSVCFLTGLDGFTAAKIVSMLFFALAVIPLMALMNRIYSMKIAVGAGFVYLIAEPLLRFSFTGLRETEKCFLILLTAYSLVRIYQERKGWTGYLWAGIAAGLAVLTRVDLIPFAALAIFFCIRLDVGYRGVPVRSLCTSAMAFLLSLPALILNWKTTGVVVPESRLARFLPATWPSLFIGIFFVLAFAYAVSMGWVRIPAKIRSMIAMAGICAVVSALFIFSIHLGLFSNPEAGGKYVRSILSGAISYYGIFSGIGIVIRLFQRKWKKEETILLVLSVFHTVMLLGVILLMEKKLYISDRYLLPALPLSFAWCFIGALVPLYILGLLFKMLPNGQNLFRVIWYATFSGFAIGAWYFSFVPLMPGHLSERKRAEREVILDFSRQIRERESVRGIPRDHIHPPFSAQKYYPDLPLKIVFLEISGKKWDRSQSKIHVISYLAGGREVVDGEKPDYIVTKYEPSMELALPISEARLLSRAAGNRCVYELWSCGEE